MKSHIETNHRLNGVISALPLIENTMQNKDDRLVKRNGVLPNLTSCDLVSDDQSFIGSRTLSGDSQCFESFPFVNIQPLNHSINEERTVESSRNTSCDISENEMIFGFKDSRYFESEIRSLKNIDGKLKQTNERRAGRPPLDRSDYFCQICSATKTPQWRYISVCSVESKLRVCNACWMKQRKKRDGKCIPLHMGISSGLNCTGISGVIKTPKIGINKENHDPQRQNLVRGGGGVAGMSYKMNRISGKNVNTGGSLSNIANSVVNKDCKIIPRGISDNLNSYICSESLKSDSLNCNNGNFSVSNSQCIKQISFRSSPYSVNTGIVCSDSNVECKTCEGNACCCYTSIIGSQSISISTVVKNISDSSVKICSKKLSTNCNNGNPIETAKTPLDPISGQTNYNKGPLINSNFTKYSENTKIETHVDEKVSNMISNFSINERLVFDINASVDNLDINARKGGEYFTGCSGVGSSNNPEESPIRDLNQSPSQNRIGNVLGNSLFSRQNPDNRTNLITGGKLSISTPVHHQASTTVSPNTNYCNISSYTSSPCQSFATYDGPFLEDPNKTMYISSSTFYYSSTDSGRWSEDAPTQAPVVMNSCINGSNNSENTGKIEGLSFSLDQDVHANSLSQVNEQLDHEQVNYTTYNKHLAVTESWSSDYLQVDMFCIPTEKSSINSESSTSISHYSVGSKFYNASTACALSAGYSTGFPQESENSSQNDCNTWDFDSSSISCMDTWQNSFWYDSYSN
ncbi:GATA zinc finger domain-containing protein [Cryptosporidium felis]|nr:GATA zinc finger domain-containing protein [Cryptosporidium felis]